MQNHPFCKTGVILFFLQAVFLLFKTEKKWPLDKNQAHRDLYCIFFSSSIDKWNTDSVEEFLKEKLE